MQRLSHLIGALLCMMLVCLAACERKPLEQAAAPEPSTPAAESELVVYCSADAAYFQPVLDAFTAHTGIKVRPLFDTEATKTFGLVQRLLSEKDLPRADVFVSSEALGMIRLDRAGILAPHTCPAAEEAFTKVGGWPKSLRSSNGTWYGFARRTRVLVYNTKFVQPSDVPTRLADLTQPRWKGRVAMARPQFGTTRTHVAALRLSHTPDAFEAWLRAMRENNLRLYDGNSSVVRAVASGDVHIGLTDNDDYHAGLANNWPIAMTLAGDRLQAMTHDRAPGPAARAANDARTSASPDTSANTSAHTPPTITLPYPENALQIPHTVAIINGTPRAELAGRFVEFVLSHQADDVISRGEAKTYPTFHVLFQDPVAATQTGSPAQTSANASATTRDQTSPLVLLMLDVSQEQIADQADEALAVFEQIVEDRR